MESGREYVLETRLPAILNNAGLSTVDELISTMLNAPQGKAASALLQAMTINETMFFRDNTPFVNIRDHIVPALAAEGPPRVLRFWCAACSSGQEPYSLAITLDQLKEHYPGWNFRIYASDLSEDMIARAQAGLYTDFETGRGLTPELRDRYFKKDQGQWRVEDRLRAMIDFAPMNLLRIPANIGPFDVILCRNVLIYFDVAQKTSILSALRKTSRVPGYLIAGAAEVLSGITNEYEAHPSWKSVYVTR